MTNDTYWLSHANSMYVTEACVLACMHAYLLHSMYHLSHKDSMHITEACVRACMHTYIIYQLQFLHACMHAYITHASYMHRQTSRQTDTYTYTHTHTHTHTTSNIPVDWKRRHAETTHTHNRTVRAPAVRTNGACVSAPRSRRPVRWRLFATRARAGEAKGGRGRVCEVRVPSGWTRPKKSAWRCGCSLPLTTVARNVDNPVFSGTGVRVHKKVENLPATARVP